jgi:hypothetical protein
MEQILVQGFKIDINHFKTQISKSGRPFRLSGVEIVRTKPAQWVNKMLLHVTIYSFRYLDEQDGFFAFEFDPFNNFISKL